MADTKQDKGKGTAGALPIELTEIGEQYLIPGCEKRPGGSKPRQMGLWE